MHFSDQRGFRFFLSFLEFEVNSHVCSKNIERIGISETWFLIRNRIANFRQHGLQTLDDFRYPTNTKNYFPRLLQSILLNRYQTTSDFQFFTKWKYYCYRIGRCGLDTAVKMNYSWDDISLKIHTVFQIRVSLKNKKRFIFVRNKLNYLA